MKCQENGKCEAAKNVAAAIPFPFFILHSSFFISTQSLQFSKVYAPELEKRRAPFAVLAIAMMLQRDRSTLGNAGKSGFFQHQPIVQPHRQPVSHEDDVECIPFPDRPVRPDTRGNPGANLRGERRIGAVSPHLAGTDGPAPDVDLGFVLAAQENS